MKPALQAFLVAVSVLALAGCGGGSSGTSASSNAATQSTSGTMTKASASSITVNGKSFDISRASVVVNKAPATAADLKSGMRVQVKSRGNDDATEVENEGEVRGAVTAVSAATTPQSFMIGAVKVIVDANTVYDDLTPASFDGIKEGVVVEVNGTRNAAGDIVATRVEGKPAGGRADDDQLHGTVTAVRTASIMIDSTTVNVTATTVFKPAATCSLASIKTGSKVEARGVFNADGSFTASRIECEDQEDGDDNGNAPGGEVEVEGLVSKPDTTAKTFSVDTQAVRYTDTTEFKDGTVANLVADARVEVKGTLDGATLVATRIEFKEP